MYRLSRIIISRNFTSSKTLNLRYKKAQTASNPQHFETPEKFEKVNPEPEKNPEHEKFWKKHKDKHTKNNSSSKNKNSGFDPSFELQNLLRKTIKSHHNHNIVAYDLLLQRQNFQLNSTSQTLQSQAIKELLYIEVLQISKFENTHILKLVETMNLPEIFGSEIKFRNTLQKSVSLFCRTLAVDNTDVNRAICGSPKLLFFDAQSLRARMDSLKNKNYFPFFHRDLKDLFLLSPGVWYCEDIADIVAKIDYILKNMNIDPAKGVIKTYDANSRQNEIKKLVKSKKRYVELSLFDIKCRHQFLLRRGQWTAQDNRGRVIGGDNANPMLDDILGAKNKYVFCLKTAKCQLEKERFEKSLEVEIFEKEDKNPGNWCIREFEQFELMFERELELSNKSLDEKLAFEERVLTIKNYRAGDNALRRDRSSLNSDYAYDEKYVKGLVEFEYNYLLEESANEQSDLVAEMKNDIVEQTPEKFRFSKKFRPRYNQNK